MTFTASTKPYLSAFYSCSDGNVIDAQESSVMSFDANIDNMTMRIGQAPDSSLSSYPIATESIQVIVNRQNPLTQLSPDQVQSLFTGRIQNWKDLQGADELVQVWVFSIDEDIEQLFEQAVLQGTPLTSLAHLAVSPADMATAVAKDPNAIGILTKSWKADGIKSLSTVAEAPVLIYTASEPEGALRTIIDCLQK